MGNLLKRKYEHDTKEEMAAESSTQARPEDSLGLPSHGIFDDLKSLADQLDKLEEGVARIKRSVDELNSRLDPMAPQMQRPDMDYTVDDFNGSEITALLSPSYEYTSHGEEDMWEGSEMVRSGGTCSDDAPFTILDEPTKELYRRFWDEMAPPRAMELCKSHFVLTPSNIAANDRC